MQQRSRRATNDPREQRAGCAHVATAARPALLSETQERKPEHVERRACILLAIDPDRDRQSIDERHHDIGQQRARECAAAVRAARTAARSTPRLHRAARSPIPGSRSAPAAPATRRAPAARGSARAPAPPPATSTDRRSRAAERTPRAPLARARRDGASSTRPSARAAFPCRGSGSG